MKLDPTATLPLAPVAAAERIERIDVLRGFALLGILLVNMPLFNSPLALELSDIEWWPRLHDRAVELGIQFLAQGKFYSLFSVLFGIGFAIQLDRAATRGVDGTRFFQRRMSWLLAIGLAHAVLLWFGDILVTYALVGLLLPLFRRVPRRALLRWIAGLLLVPLALMALTVATVELERLLPASEGTGEAETQAPLADEQAVERARATYAEGSFGEILAQRLQDLGVVYSSSLFYVPNVLALFLLGLLLARSGFLGELAPHRPLLRRVAGWLLAIGITGNLLMVAAGAGADPSTPSPLSLASELGFTFGAPALCLFYMTALALLWEHDRWRRRLRPLAAVGRMALTNYLLQSAICTTLFNSYGLGLYGRVSPTAGLLLSVAIFLSQVAASNLWLRRFRFGPAEWLWRSLTYGRAQPMRLAKAM